MAALLFKSRGLRDDSVLVQAQRTSGAGCQAVQAGRGLPACSRGHAFGGHGVRSSSEPCRTQHSCGCLHALADTVSHSKGKVATGPENTRAVLHLTSQVCSPALQPTSAACMFHLPVLTGLPTHMPTPGRTEYHTTGKGTQMPRLESNAQAQRCAPLQSQAHRADMKPNGVSKVHGHQQLDHMQLEQGVLATHRWANMLRSLPPQGTGTASRSLSHISDLRTQRTQQHPCAVARRCASGQMQRGYT